MSWPTHIAAAAGYVEESGITAAVRCLVGIYSNVGQHLYYDGVTNVPTKVMFDFILFLCDEAGISSFIGQNNLA